jgi:hypothetical protein
MIKQSKGKRQKHNLKLVSDGLFAFVRGACPRMHKYVVNKFDKDGPFGQDQSISLQFGGGNKTVRQRAPFNVRQGALLVDKQAIEKRKIRRCARNGSPCGGPHC